MLCMLVVDFMKLRPNEWWVDSQERIRDPPWGFVSINSLLALYMVRRYERLRLMSKVDDD